MEISISLKNHAENQITHLVAMLRTMDFVENVEIKSDKLSNEKTISNKFDQYNGIWKSKLSNDEIDVQLNTLRNEWEQVI